MRIHFAFALSVILVTGCGQDDSAPVRDSSGVENPPSSAQTSESHEGRGEPEESKPKVVAAQVPAATQVALGAEPPDFLKNELRPLEVVQFSEVSVGLNYLQFRLRHENSTEVMFHLNRSEWSRQIVVPAIVTDGVVASQEWTAVLEGWDTKGNYSQLWSLPGCRIAGQSLSEATTFMRMGDPGEKKIRSSAPIVLDSREGFPQKTDYFRGGFLSVNLPPGQQVLFCYPKPPKEGFGVELECRKEPEFKDLRHFGRLLID